MNAATNGVRGAALVLLACALGGCASLTPTLTPPASAPAPAVPATRTATTNSATAAATPPKGTLVTGPADSTAHRASVIVPADSLPSPEAQRVVATLPEPVPAAERVRAPADTMAQGAAAIPTPAPTAPLGDRPGGLERMLTPDSTSAPPPPPADTARGSAAHQAKATGPCFKLQVGAPGGATKAEQLRRAATSQLDLEFDIVKLKGRYKVRSRECLSREAVDHLRARAVAAGFHGVFAVEGGTR